MELDLLLLLKIDVDRIELIINHWVYLRCSHQIRHLLLWHDVVLLRHNLVNLLVYLIVPVFNELVYLEVIRIHPLKFICLLWACPLDSLEHIHPDVVISPIIYYLLWYFLFLIFINMYKVTKFTTGATLWSMKVSTLNCLPIIVFNYLRLQLIDNIL